MKKSNNIENPVNVIQVNDDMSEEDLSTAVEMITPALLNGQNPRNRSEKRKLRKQIAKKFRKIMFDIETTRITPYDK